MAGPSREERAWVKGAQAGSAADLERLITVQTWESV
jgi:hypothetical protein